MLGVRRIRLVQDCISYEDGNELFGFMCGKEYLDDEGKGRLGRRVCMVEEIQTIL
jgi:hypothetical protein